MASHSVVNAPIHAIIEYPGPVKSTNKALTSLGGINHVSNALLLPEQRVIADQEQQSRHQKNLAPSIDLHLAQPGNSFHHPVPAAIIPTANIVVKVTKRRRKQPLRDPNTGQVIQDGVFMYQIAGIADQTVRFRAMADFQYTVNRQDPVVAVADSVRNMDVSAIQRFSMPEPNEVFTEDSFLPPPSFTRLAAPQIYDFRAAPSTVPVTVTRNGRTFQRLANSTRFRARPIRSITFERHPPTRGDDGQLIPAQGELPMAPTDAELKDITGRGDVHDERQVFEHDALELKLLGLLAERPMWTRTALYNQLEEEERRKANNQKFVMSAVSYTFADGPWRDLVVRFGYDPREDPEARFYQNIAFRNTANVRSKAQAIRHAPGQAPVDSQFAEPTRSHIFDGVNVNSKIGNFQLCDVTDPLLRAHIDNLEACSATLESVSDTGVPQWSWSNVDTDDSGPACTRENGWWRPGHLEQIRQILRRKFFALLETGNADVDCRDLLGDPTRFVDSATAAAAAAVMEDYNALGPDSEVDDEGSDVATGGSGKKKKGRPKGSTKDKTATARRKSNPKPKKKKKTATDDETSQSDGSSIPSFGGESGGEDIDFDQQDAEGLLEGTEAGVWADQETRSTRSGRSVAPAKAQRGPLRKKIVATQEDKERRRSRRNRGPKAATETEEQRAQKLQAMTRGRRERRDSRSSAGASGSGQSEASGQRSRAGSDPSVLGHATVQEQAAADESDDDDDIYS